MSHGRVIEQGTHNDLLQKRSMYYELVEKQRMSTERGVGLSESNKHPELLDLGSERNEFEKQTLEMGQHQGAEDCERYPEVKADNCEYSLWQLIKIVANFNKEETLTMVWGLLFSVITGAGNPT